MKYKRGTLADYPILELKLLNILGEEFPRDLKLPVDIGYEGSIMLTSDDYEFFSIGELPREYWRTYSTLTGYVLMRVARALAVIGDMKLEVYVETPYFGFEKRLVGRELLNRFIVILDGPRKLICIARVLTINYLTLLKTYHDLLDLLLLLRV